MSSVAALCAPVAAACSGASTCVFWLAVVDPRRGVVVEDLRQGRQARLGRHHPVLQPLSSCSQDRRAPVWWVILLISFLSRHLIVSIIVSIDLPRVFGKGAASASGCGCSRSCSIPSSGSARPRYLGGRRQRLCCAGRDRAVPAACPARRRTSGRSGGRPTAARRRRSVRPADHAAAVGDHGAAARATQASYPPPPPPAPRR